MLRPQRHEWEVAFAPGGEAALALMEAAPFDVIVSDMRMPGMDGAALLDRVRKVHPQVVRIILSGNTELSTALRVVPIAHQFLAKPCDIKMLRVAVERACHLKALLHDNSIRRTVGGLEGLPSVPRTYHALTLALADPDTSIEKIARIVELDVGISAKILQLVNSAFFGSGPLHHQYSECRGLPRHQHAEEPGPFRGGLSRFCAQRPAGGILLGGSPAPCSPHVLHCCPPPRAESSCRYRHGLRHAPRCGKARHGLEASRELQKAHGGRAAGAMSPLHRGRERKWVQPRRDRGLSPGTLGIAVRGRRSRRPSPCPESRRPPEL